jgi:hypothetical protein
MVALAASAASADGAAGRPTSAPAISNEAAKSITSDDAVIHARIKTGRLPTQWSIQVGAPETYLLTYGCHEVPGEATCELIWQQEILSEGTLAPSGGRKEVSSDVYDLDGLLYPGEEYHYRVVASNALGVTYGPDRTFTTKG